jgi:hypothetical protein
MNKESLAHYYGKHAIRNWLIERVKEGNGKCYILNWHVHQAAESDVCKKGISLEYPIIRTLNGEVLGLLQTWNEYPKEQTNLKIEAVIDVMVSHNGKPRYGIEVVHKHICDDRKRQLLAQLAVEHNMTFYEISAEWVMNQLIDRIPPVWPLVKIS